MASGFDPVSAGFVEIRIDDGRLAERGYAVADLRADTRDGAAVFPIGDARRWNLAIAADGAPGIRSASGLRSGLGGGLALLSRLPLRDTRFARFDQQGPLLRYTALARLSNLQLTGGDAPTRRDGRAVGLIRGFIDAMLPHGAGELCRDREGDGQPDAVATHQVDIGIAGKLRQGNLHRA